MKQVVIIGNGVAGATCARTLRKMDSDVEITMISRESLYHFSRPALMYLYMGHMEWRDVMPYPTSFWQDNRINIVQDDVEMCDTTRNVVKCASGKEFEYSDLVLATGSSVNLFGWPGQDAKGVQGLYTLQDVELMEESTTSCRCAVIVGGGLIGIEMCEMLCSRNIPVTFLVRESGYWSNVLPKEESAMVAAHMRKHGVDLRFQTELKEIVAPEGTAQAVITSKGERIDCDFVGLTAGVHPNTSLAEQSGIRCQRGICVDSSLRTSVPNVWSAGDCAEILHGDDEKGVVEQLWYTGKSQGEVVAQNILGATAQYERGIWYNSAKFMDIDYHTYGQVPASSDDSNSLFWQAPNREVCLRIAVDAEDKVVGFNSLGLRLRHQQCEQWIADCTSLSQVVQQLSKAIFDPELYDDVIPDVVEQFNRQRPGGLPIPRRKNSFWSRLLPAR